jgi:F0F1-type ATP synthase membrane subunit a
VSYEELKSQKHSKQQTTVSKDKKICPLRVCVFVYIYIYNDELLFAMEFTQGVLKCLVTIYASSFSRGGDILVCSAPFVAG